MTPGPCSRRCRSATRSSPARSSGSERTFGALADSDEALAESFQILPTFQRETRATLLALDDFQVNARPLVQKLLPVANDISPTLRSVRQLSPNLEDLFRDLGPLIKAGRRGIPALGRFLGPEGLRPMLNSLAPFLGNVGAGGRVPAPVQEDDHGLPGGARLRPLEHAAGDRAPQGSPNGQDTARTYLKQLGYLGTETLSIWRHRACRPTAATPTRRPDYLANQMAATGGIFGNFDCKNTDYSPDPTGLRGSTRGRGLRSATSSRQRPRAPWATRTPLRPCFIQPAPDFFGDGRAPNLMAAP